MSNPGHRRDFINKYGIQQLFPGYFALVMATGIIAIAAHIYEYSIIAKAFFTFNLLSYGILWCFLLLRIVLYFDDFRDDLTDHNRGPGFFTVIAASNVIGCQLILQYDLYFPALLLWIGSLVLWFLITYLFFAAITIKRANPGIQKGLNGSWLIAVVATQSVALSGALLYGNSITDFNDFFLFILISFFLVGCMLYLVIITLIIYRFAFFPLKPQDISAPYWIGMGAVAISTLAGTEIIWHLNGNIFSDLIGFMKGFTLFFWAFGTWWIPLLLILGFWRHIIHKIPFPWTEKGYDPSYWGMVFPLGMYTVCTHSLAQTLNLTFLNFIPEYFIFIAFAAWIATFAGMIHMIIKNVFHLSFLQKDPEQK